MMPKLESKVESKPRMSYWQRFKTWFAFVFGLYCVFAIAQIAANVFERWGVGDTHWLTGRSSLVSFLALRLLIALALPAIFAGLAALSKSDPPELLGDKTNA